MTRWTPPTRFLPALLVLLPLSLAAGAAQAGVTVWRDKEQRGPSQHVQGAVPDLRKIGLDDQISSLTAEEPWLVCSEPRYRGECRTVEGTVENLHGSGMNDRISSMRPAAQGRARGWGRNRGHDRYTDRNDRRGDDRYDDRYASGPRPMIRVYEHEDYKGVSQTFDGAVRDLTTIGLARQITSVRIDRGEWEVCNRANYGGRCQILRASDDDLDDWSDAIVSLRPVGDDRSWSDAQDRGDRWNDARDDRWRSGTRIRVYADRDFSGRSETFEREVPDLRRYGLFREVMSLQIEGGPWEICSEPSFRGDCKVVRDSDAYLGWWAEHVASLRPARDVEDR
jgi:hypothetical protein